MAGSNGERNGWDVAKRGGRRGTAAGAAYYLPNARCWFTLEDVTRCRRGSGMAFRAWKIQAVAILLLVITCFNGLGSPFIRQWTPNMMCSMDRMFGGQTLFLLLLPASGLS